MFDREIAIYRALQAKNVQTHFITHGLADDLAYQTRIPDIKIYPNKKGRSPERYEAWLPFLHARPLLQSDVIKTNQMNGAEVALRAAQIFRKPLIARCGYLWSEFAALEHDAAFTQKVIDIENRVFQAARQIIVTTPMMRDSIAKRLPQVESKMNVIPNFVETDRFAPMNLPLQVDLIFIGRLHPQKNIESLLAALQPLDVSLQIIGAGGLENELKAKFHNSRVEWRGNMPNSEIPTQINQAKIFILPSHYEGHPKTLIEAMACGKAVIGGNSPGIREVIQHGKTGWLCETDAGSLRAAIQHLLQNPALCTELGKNARQYALENYALDKVVEMEYTVIQKALF